MSPAFYDTDVMTSVSQMQEEASGVKSLGIGPSLSPCRRARTF